MCEEDKMSFTVDNDDTELYIKIHHKQFKKGLCYLLTALTGFFGLFGINTAFVKERPERQQTEVVK